MSMLVSLSSHACWELSPSVHKVSNGSKKRQPRAELTANHRNTKAQFTTGNGEGLSLVIPGPLQQGTGSHI